MIELSLKSASRFVANVTSNKGIRSLLLGKIYEMAVKATKHVSATISGSNYKNFVNLMVLISSSVANSYI